MKFPWQKEEKGLVRVKVTRPFQFRPERFIDGNETIWTGPARVVEIDEVIDVLPVCAAQLVFENRVEVLQ